MTGAPPPTSAPSHAGIGFGVLGSLEVRLDGEPLLLPGHRERALVALLLTEPGRTFTVAAIVTALWGDAAPPRAAKTVQSYVSRLRHALRAGGDDVVVTRVPGYLAAVEPQQIDAERFRAMAARGRDDLAAGRPAAAVGVLREALGLWRGEPYAEFENFFAVAERSALEELRLTVVQDRLTGELAMGAGPELVGELDVLTAGHPWRERLWGLLMTALVRAGRQADALAAYARARATLHDELGLEPGPELREVHRQVLTQDARLLGGRSGGDQWGTEGAAVSAFSVVSVPGGTMGDMTTRVASPRLVGRVAELAVLQRGLAEAAAGRQTTVLVGGEAGVGKSRLVEEFTERAVADGARVLVGRCVELGEDGLPFAPFVAALRSLLAEAGAEALAEAAGPGRDTLARLLPEVGPVGPDSPTGRGRLFEVVATLLERLGAEQPVVLVLEDLHWADGSTRDLLRFLVRVLPGARVLVVATYRSDEMRRGHPLRPLLAELERLRAIERVEVPRLTPPEVGSLLAAILDHDPSADVVDDVHRRSEGIPFFVEELASCSDSLLGGELPESLRDLLLVRAEQLTPDAYSVLRLAAVGGSRVEHDVLAAVCELPEAELEACLREAVAGHVLVVDDTGYAFRHALLREVLHDDLLPGEHARLHVRYAQVLEERPELMGGRPVWVESAHHWHAAHDTERAFRASLRAADEATAAFAHAEAQRMLERAIELWHQVDDPAGVARADRPELLRRASTAAGKAGDAERSLALVEAAVEEVDEAVEPARAAHLLERQGQLLFQLGRTEAAVDVLEHALELVGPEGHPLDRAGALQVLAIVQMLQWWFTEAARTAREAIGLVEQVRSQPVGADDVVGAVAGICDEDAVGINADSVESGALNTLGVCLVALGRTGEGLAALERSRAVAIAGQREAALDRYYINASDTLLLLGRYAESVEVAREGMTEATRRGLTRTTWPFLAGNAAEPLLMLGEWQEARRLVDRALELDPPHAHAMHLRHLQAWLVLRTGEMEEARRLVGELEARLLRRGPAAEPQFAVALAGLSAELALELGQPERALEIVRHCLQEQPEQPAMVWSVVLVGARSARRLTEVGHDLAGDVWQELRAAAERLDWWDTAAFWRPLFDAEVAGDDPDLWRAAAAALESWPGPVHLQGSARLRLAAALVGHGDRSAATEALAGAARVADRLGDVLLAAEVDGLARRARLELPGTGLTGTGLTGTAAGGGRPDETPHGLTPRELQVLRLVAAGRSNRQIGEELFISTKTASVHVSNILAKLGVSGRGAAAAVAHRDGLLGDELLPA
ncbi:MAG TPA: BTAD domain-containing putative transcriptional regulator [Jiangellales bacterium]|nr:BTAD domain-containing putative transcriptional regulator [Jiangellales bacterium]